MSFCICIDPIGQLYFLISCHVTIPLLFSDAGQTPVLSCFLPFWSALQPDTNGKDCMVSIPHFWHFALLFTKSSWKFQNGAEDKPNQNRFKPQATGQRHFYKTTWNRFSFRRTLSIPLQWIPWIMRLVSASLKRTLSRQSDHTFSFLLI